MSLTPESLLCPFCKTTSPSIRYSFNSCAILRCHECGLMWLHPKLDPGALHQIYNNDYYFNQRFFQTDGTKLYGYVDYLSERMNKQYGYRKIVTKVKKQLLQNSMGKHCEYNWLDVGCGLGFLMDVAFDQGFGVSGVEFNPAAVDYIRSKYTFPVKCGSLGDLEFSETYHVISMFDVVEHLLDPIGNLQKLREIVADDGYLLIQTMDSESLVSRLLGKRLEDFRRTREHLFFFSRASIKTILEHCGWQVCEVQSIGHTFQVSSLIDRISVYWPLLSRLVKPFVYPKWLLEANVYINPGTKMLVYARPR